MHGNRDLGIDGVMALTQGLQASSLTRLIRLNLKNVGLNDEGLKTLTDMIESWTFGDAEVICKGVLRSGEDDVSDSSDDDLASDFTF